MTIQSSGPVSLSDIQTEFGGSNPISLSEYYRGGAYVPSSQTSIPASGLITLSDFYGTSDETIITVTQGKSDSSSGWVISYVRGYNGISGYAIIGSRTPTSFAGRTVGRALFTNISYVGNFHLSLSGTLAKSFFTSATFQGSSALLTANATFSTSGGYSHWKWDTSSYNTTWDGVGNVTVILT